MLDFLMVSTRLAKRGIIEIYPKFIIKQSKDLMIKGGDFYAIFDESKQLWSTSEQDAINLIDNEVDEYARKNASKYEDHVVVKHMWDAESGVIDAWHKFVQKQMRDNFIPLDEKLIFANDETKREDYASKKLSYSLECGDTPAYDEMMSVLYTEDERHKIEWSIGAIVSGEARNIQKFAVLYGPPGSGKSTILNIIQMLFEGYYTMFDAESLGSSTDVFALEQFKSNPIVAICHDGDLSKIEKNTRLNSLVSHETVPVNEKHKSIYTMRFNSFLFMGTNKPVKITDAKSGIIRRLIDISPVGGKKFTLAKYNSLMSQIKFELGHIANKCKELYLEDRSAYDDYVPTLMMDESNDFYNFVSDTYQIFKKDNGTSLKSAWELYKMYCDDAKVPYPYSMRVFKSELKNYFETYEERIRVGDDWVRSYYQGFKSDIFDEQSKPDNKIEQTSGIPDWLDLKEEKSILDETCKDCSAQYASDSGKPQQKWAEVTTTLKDLDSSKLHYLKLPENHIVIDFDMKDADGNKSPELNLKEAKKWPKTYAEFSKSGGGVHLHYIYNGDPSTLSRLYADDIEIKVFTGNSSLRRKLTKCNSEQINTISSGLPLRENKKMINFEAVNNEKALRTIIRKNLNKEYHPATKPSMDFIFKVLEDAYCNGVNYDISDMYNAILAFAASSTNQADYCLKLIPKIHFKSEEYSEFVNNDEKPIVFYDVEVFPNLLIVDWKFQGPGKKVVKMINPTSQEIEALLKYRLVGFNCRRYDNHILYARLLGKSNKEIYKLSSDIINEKKGFFGEAYNISYTDIYDYASKKQSLKKWEIELGIHHKEWGRPWTEEVPESLWGEAASYCENDVISTEAVWDATESDFKARKILADIAGMTVNDTTNSLTQRIVFGNEKNPKLVYTDLSEEFPGYQFEKVWNPDTKKYDKHNWYRGVDLGLGGYVYSEEGMYGNAALLDIQSLHPSSAICLNAFGEYTKNFKMLKDIRVHIKHKEYDAVKAMFDGKLAKYMDDPEHAKELSQALKIAINAVYGLTSANFANAFRDPRNENNFIALRGALFMKTLQDEVVARGFKVAHIKTDSIKIPDATKEIVDFCMDFAKQYGYVFEHEATYEKICLVNDAVYIAKYATEERCKELYGYVPEKNEKEPGMWTATGTQFQVPYVFKTLFAKEQVEFRDLCEAKEVKGAMYLRYPNKFDEAGNPQLRFVGKVGLFCPIKPGEGGAELVREQTKKDGSIGLDAVTGTKGYLWMESEDVYDADMQDAIDLSYYNTLANDAIDTINKYGDYEWFVSDDPYIYNYNN